MFDVGFWELLVIAVVLLLVLGPERLPEVAKQAAFFVRKARQGMFRIRSEMRSELGGDPFEDLKEARREVANLKNDMKQFGRDLSDSHEAEIAKQDQKTVDDNGAIAIKSKASASEQSTTPKKKVSKKTTTKKTAGSTLNSKKSTTKKKAAKKKVTKKVSTKKTSSKKKV